MTTLRNFNLEVAVAPGAFAYAYPASATRLIIPFASCGATDILARTFAAVVMCAGIKPD